MPINLANINVSLQQFQAISHGKYNAGEVALASETTLGKINNHVHSTGKNKTELSHAEVLAIKQAFVKALTQGGVGADEIARVRRELGLGTDKTVDRRRSARATSSTPASRRGSASRAPPRARRSTPPSTRAGRSRSSAASRSSRRSWRATWTSGPAPTGRSS